MGDEPVVALAVNVGSSSLKLSLHDAGVALGDDGDLPPAPLWAATCAPPFDALPALLASTWTDPGAPIREPASIAAVGHRVVHGGAEHRTSAVVTAEVREAITRSAASAPAHNGLELAAVDAVTRLLGPDVPQVAVFDTAFHDTLPPSAYTYAGPHAWLAMGIRRYGFHGVSHAYASRRAAFMLGRDVGALWVVTCHLGGGCSLAAVRGGRSVDTTMGFTPLDGVPMATRAGSVDPGILLHLLRTGATGAELDHILNYESGLAGLSGLSGEMRELLAAAAAGHARAELALGVYVHRLRQAVAATAASMNGIDALVFTGGVGERAAVVRARTCDGLGFLGLEIDAAANAACAGDAVISAPSSRAAVVVVRSQENWMVAREAVRVAGRSA